MRGEVERWPTIVGVVAALLILGGLTWAFGLIFHQAREADARWVGSELVRVCRDGTYVYHLRDGTYQTGGWPGSRVSGPEVCH
jgi:hypothetical protein